MASQVRSRRGTKPGLRALAACGDGFWELDLLNGSAWYSDWFYRRLGWPLEAKRSALEDLREVVDAEQWAGFMRSLRAHLEQAAPLELRLSVKCVDGSRQWWHFKGSAERTQTGLPVHLAGCARELQPAESSSCACGIFDALPGAVAILDSEGRTLFANQAWLLRLSREDLADLAQAMRKGGAAMIEVSLNDARKRPMSALKARLIRVGRASDRWLAVLEGT